MADFFTIFAGLDYWGPGSPQTTARALAAVPFAPRNILEIGCGNGVATQVLATQSSARITAIDTDEGALGRLRGRAMAAGVADRIATHCLDMAQLPPPDAAPNALSAQPLREAFDLIWAEGSAYIIGVERALTAWWPLLRQDGVLVFSDLVWLTDQPSPELQDFWAAEYPAMTRVAQRLEQARQAGYRVLSHFDMGQTALDTYYQPLVARVEALASQLAGQRVLDDLRRELRAYHEGQGQFSYAMFVLERR